MPGASCADAVAGQVATQQKQGAFQFEDVDCQASKLANKTTGLATGDSQHAAPAVEDMLLLDSIQSPLPAIRETGEIMAKLVLMYVLLEVAAGLMKGQSPVQHLLLAGVHLKLVFQAMLAPLSMMCSGFALALVQYSLLLKKQQQRAPGSQPTAAAGAAQPAGRKGKAE